MLIRIIKRLPAPLMDGFDVSRFREKRMYEVESRLGRYLVVAGYGKPMGEKTDDRAKPRSRRESQ